MKIVIEGAGEVGRHLAKMLCNEAHDVLVIDPNNSRLKKLRAIADVMTIESSPSSIKTMKEAGVASADLFIAVNPSTAQEVNIVSSVIAKNLGAKKVVARISDEDYLANKNMFKQIGIELLFYPEKLAATEIVDLLKHTASTESMDFAHGKIQMAVFKLEEDSPLLEMNLMEFSTKFGKDKPEMQFRVVAVASDGKTIMPKPQYRFRYHDLVFIMARREALQVIMEFLGKNNIEVNKVMILGATRISEIVARQLFNTIDDIKIIDNDKDVCDALSKKLEGSINVVHGDGRDSDFLLEENIKNYDAFVALTENDEANILACVVAKKFGVERTIAEVENLEYIRLADEMGVDAVINKKLITAGRIFKFTLSNKARVVKYMSGTNAEVLEYTVPKDSYITKAPLMDLKFPSDAIIAGVTRGNDAFVAVGTTQIEAFDKVAVFSLPSAVKEVDKFFR